MRLTAIAVERTLAPLDDMGVRYSFAMRLTSSLSQALTPPDDDAPAGALGSCPFGAMPLAKGRGQMVHSICTKVSM